MLLLSSCFSPVKFETTTYELGSTPDVPKAKSAHPKTILVLLSDSDSIYNTTQIAYTIRPYQVSYFSKNVWADTPTNMLEPLLIQTLQNTNHYRAVVSSDYMGNYNYILSVQLLKLEQDFTTKPSVVRLSIRAQIIRAGTNQLIATKEFSTVESAQLNTPYCGVIAANRATARILGELANFSLRYTR